MTGTFRFDEPSMNLVVASRVCRERGGLNIANVVATEFRQEVSS